MAPRRNGAAETATVGLELFAESGRAIHVEAEPTAVEPGGKVVLTATVTEPTDADVVHLVVIRDRQRVAELEPERVSDTTWRISYDAPATGGFYAVSGRVDGGPPRQMSGIIGFEVAHRGTSITGFEERTEDTDGDGLIDWVVVRVRFDVSTSGTYMMIAALTDEAGTSLPVGGGGGNVMNLQPGSHVQALRWSGAALRETGTPGPYGIAHVQLTRIEPSFRTEADVAELGQTRAYDLAELDPELP
jgi:hypothetical protein